jgi:hypothetical protein
MDAKQTRARIFRRERCRSLHGRPIAQSADRQPDFGVLRLEPFFDHTAEELVLSHTAASRASRSNRLCSNALISGCAGRCSKVDSSAG